MSHAQHDDRFTIDRKDNAMSRSPADAEMQFAKSQRMQIRFWSEGATLGHIPQRVNRNNDPTIPMQRFIGGTMIPPPLKRFLDVLIGRFGDDEFEHSSLDGQAVATAKLAVKIFKRTNATGLHGLQARTNGDSLGIAVQ